MNRFVCVLLLVWACACGCEKTQATSVALPEVSASASASAAPVASSFVAPLALPTAFFPPRTFPERVDSFVSAWYGKHLTAMHEPSLWAEAVRGRTVLRFLWLRTWGKPIAIRVAFDQGRAHLYTTRLSGSGGYDPGQIELQRDRDLTSDAWRRLQDALGAASYDAIDTEGASGMDGAQWIIESAKSGAYRLVERWSPEHDPKNAAFKAACDVFLDLAGRDVITGDVY